MLTPTSLRLRPPANAVTVALRPATFVHGARSVTLHCADVMATAHNAVRPVTVSHAWSDSREVR